MRIALVQNEERLSITWNHNNTRSKQDSSAKNVMGSGVHDPAKVKLLAFTASVNDVFLIATIIAVIALPLSLFIRKHQSALMKGTIDPAK